ncbi:MAG TPA: hypothetical protein VGH33_08115 [Isosphaeraceae bacterium]
MPNPHLDDAEFPKLKKVGPSNGTVSGSDIAVPNPVFIQTKDGKRQWLGTVVSATDDPLTWDATVFNILWNRDDKLIPETVTVTVSNASGPSNPVDTTADVS